MEEPKKKKAAAKKKPAGAPNNTAFCRIVKGRRLAGEEAGSEWCRRDKGDWFFADRLLLSWRFGCCGGEARPISI
ncbi:MAG: hypothetical protein E5Y65_26360 [Mesorhizobium sp.]|uniref:hypothetical protein n=1 Tax=Mesorhizobium sp. TaxID=1871066 RepID=UPI00120A7D20|nr:hypothetical protein [Mesorhizobium sp.]TIL72226.1 MAG: hypothetical protein E5Y70_22140 [Mesorhizobium sp.]TIL86662.1 MAG: hypothetical protein E5Y65_26360 [Mesorhizobium sp.]TIL98335.1 MAG: hypothetical protein E5Y64_26160 [Mesorhizobium sp.]TIM35047.1 MAG: hypothetical protein E5Y61_09340 [Mesorhizobium sp.]